MVGPAMHEAAPLLVMLRLIVDGDDAALRAGKVVQRCLNDMDRGEVMIACDGCKAPPQVMQRPRRYPAA
jgi:hypothetical protein